MLRKKRRLRLFLSKKRLRGWLSRTATGRHVSGQRADPATSNSASINDSSSIDKTCAFQPRKAGRTGIMCLSRFLPVFHGIAVPPRNNTDDVPVDFPGPDWWKCINTNVASYPRPFTLPQRPSAPKRKLWGKIPINCHLEGEHRRDG